MWPTAPEAIMLWMELLLVWMLVGYVFVEQRTVRMLSRLDGTESGERGLVILKNGLSLTSVLLGFATAAITGGMSGSWWVGGLFGGLVVAVPLGRTILASHADNWAAEWEIGCNVFIVAISSLLIAALDLKPSWSFFNLPLSPLRIASISLVTASVIFLTRTSTHIVRGVLGKAGTLPKKRRDVPCGDSQESEEVDQVEYNRGRTIGNLERLLLAMAVTIGHYEALGFIVAAKGLIRIKQFEDRDFAEYFLIGSLTSVMIAVIVGFIIRHALIAWW